MQAAQGLPRGQAQPLRYSRGLGVDRPAADALHDLVAQFLQPQAGRDLVGVFFKEREDAACPEKVRAGEEVYMEHVALQHFPCVKQLPKQQGLLRGLDAEGGLSRLKGGEKVGD